MHTDNKMYKVFKLSRSLVTILNPTKATAFVILKLQIFQSRYRGHGRA